MKILYVEDDEDIRELFVMKIESKYELDIIETPSKAEALSILNKDPEIKLILSDYNLLDGDAGDFYLQLRKMKLNIPFILFTGEAIEDLDSFKTFFADNKLNAHVSKPPVGNSLFDSLECAIKAVTPLGIKKTLSQTMEYVKIRTSFFEKINHCPTDVYIKLSETKFVKVFHRDEMCGSEDDRKYIDRGVQHLFINKDEYEHFADFALSSLLSILLTENKLSTTAQTSSVSKLITIHQAVHEKIMNLGFSPELAEATKKAVDITVNMMESNPKLSELLAQMLKGGDYIYEHSMMISYIASAIASNVDWESRDTKIKLAMAAFMHDITLKDHDLAKMVAIDPASVAGMKDEDIEIVRKHPLEAMSLVEKIKELPPDINLIVAQHHESPKGDGFPRGLNHLTIAPLGALFVVAHIFVDYLYRENAFERPNHDPFFAILKKNYLKGNYRKPVEGLFKFFNYTSTGRIGDTN